MSDNTVFVKSNLGTTKKQQWNQKIKQWLEKNSRYTELAAAFGGGVISYNLLFGMRKDNRPVHDDNVEFGSTSCTLPPQQEAVMHEFDSTIGSHCMLATSVTDEMSFSDAFAAARAEVGAGNVFRWNSRLYNTFTESEYLSLSTAEQEAFTEGVLNVEEEFDARPIVENSDSYEEAESGLPALNIRSDIDRLEPTVAEMEKIDADGDGVADDGAFVNLDNDSQAELIIDMTNNIAFVDTGNNGFLDTAYAVDAAGNVDWNSPQTLAEGIPAPDMTVSQRMDLVGEDGIMESEGHDTDGDGYAERIMTDMNNDGKFDFAYLDTTGDNRLDTAYLVENGQLTQQTEIEPFESPIVEAMLGDAGSSTGMSTPEAEPVELDDDYDPNATVEGLISNESMEDFD